MKVKSLSRVRLLATPWTVAHQAPPSMGFSMQEYWSGVPLPSLNMDIKCYKYLRTQLVKNLRKKACIYTDYLLVYVCVHAKYLSRV